MRDTGSPDAQAVADLTLECARYPSAGSDSGASSSVASPGVPAPTAPAAPSPRVTWWPKGYEAYDAETAYRWGTPSENHPCVSGQHCVTLFVVTLHGCSSLYAEVTVEDSAHNVVDSTNDRVGRLRPKHAAKLTLVTYRYDAANASVTTIDCAS